MHCGSAGPPTTSAVVHLAAAHGGAAGVTAKNTSALNESATKNHANFFQSSRLRSHNTPARTYGTTKNDMYVVLITTSHHGGSGSFRCSCSQTVGATPKKQPFVGVGLEVPEGGPADQVGGAAAEVVQHQDEGER